MTASNEVEREILERYFTDPLWVALYPNDPAEGVGPATGAIPMVGMATSLYVAAQIGTRVQSAFTITGNVARNADDLVWSDLPSTTIQAVGLWTAEAEGKLLFHGNLVYRRLHKAGRPFRFLAGAVSVAVE